MQLGFEPRQSNFRTCDFIKHCILYIASNFCDWFPCSKEIDSVFSHFTGEEPRAKRD